MVVTTFVNVVMLHGEADTGLSWLSIELLLHLVAGELGAGGSIERTKLSSSDAKTSLFNTHDTMTKDRRSCCKSDINNPQEQVDRNHL